MAVDAGSVAVRITADTPDAHAALDRLAERVEELRGDLRGLTLDFDRARRAAERAGTSD